MTYTTTTTTAPAWATTWATMPELPTIAATTGDTKRESRAALLWATIKDYAVGTLVSINTRTRKAWRVTARAARRFLGVLLLIFGVLSTFALFVLLLNIAAPYLPNVFTLRLLLVIPAFAVAMAYELAYIKTFGTLNHYAHLMDDHGGNCPRW